MPCSGLIRANFESPRRIGTPEEASLTPPKGLFPDAGDMTEKEELKLSSSTYLTFLLKYILQRKLGRLVTKGKYDYFPPKKKDGLFFIKVNMWMLYLDTSKMTNKVYNM